MSEMLTRRRLLINSGLAGIVPSDHVIEGVRDDLSSNVTINGKRRDEHITR